MKANAKPADRKSLVRPTRDKKTDMLGEIEEEVMMEKLAKLETRL